jgi:hypothetical protein
VIGVRDARGDAFEVEIDWRWVGHLVHWRAALWSARGIEQRFSGTAETSVGLEALVQKQVFSWFNRDLQPARP